jgi:hypothetical protein
MGRLRKWLAPLVEDLARAIVAEERRQRPLILIPKDLPPLSDADREALRLAWIRQFDGRTSVSSCRGQPNEDVRVGR